MRVSSAQFFNVALESMQKHSSDVMSYQTKISSGNKYQNASDSGLAAGLSALVQLDESQFSMFKVNQDHLAASYASSETQIGSINDILIRFQQLMVQAGSDAIGADGRRAIAQELVSLKGAVVQAANAKDINGQTILKDTVHNISVASNVTLESGVLMSDVMTSSVDIIDLMDGVIDKLNPTSGLSPTSPSTAQFTNFTAALTQVNQARVRVGVLQNRLDAATQMAETQKNNVETQRSQLLDTDLAEASAGLMKSNALLSAAQSVIARIDINSLFQKL